MSDHIELEFTPAAPAPAADAPVVPELILGFPTEPEKKEFPAKILEQAVAADPEKQAYDSLNDAEKKMVDDFSEKIDLNDTNIVLQYGVASQQKIAAFSDNALAGVRTKDLGETGNLIAGLVTELKGFQVDEPEKKGLFGFIKKKASDLAGLKARYASAEKNVNQIVGVLEGHQNQLTKDSVMLDKLYETNLTYFKELTMYILAGKKALRKALGTTLPEMKAKAEASGLPEDAQAANDYAAMCDRFDKKLYDLELSRTISMQMAPQIRLIQNSDILMVEKITSTVNNTIPLWKNQMVLALGMAHAEQAMQAQKEVSDLTNELIRANAEKLKTGSIAIAQESERGIVDIESVTAANEDLITSLTEVIRIQEEGRQKRREAENQLGLIEAELKQKLLDIRNSTTEQR